jgi:hypothetical protein
MANYEITAQSATDLKRHLYQDEVFISVHQPNMSWLKEIGFTAYKPSEMKVFSQNPKFYKIEDDHIFFILFRTQDPNAGKYDVREKYKLLKSNKLIQKLKMNDDIFDDFLQYMTPSVDIKSPSMIMYLSIKRDYIYYDNNRNKKTLSYFVNVNRVMLKTDSENDFYLSTVQFEEGKLTYIEVMIDGVVKSGEPLKSVWNELSVLTPTLEEFFNFEVDLTDEMKFLFQAVAI